MYGLIALPVLGWVGGTLTGAVASTLLPAAVISALGVALYGMFIAIVVPVAKENREVLIVAGSALLFSTAFYYLPVLREISSGQGICIQIQDMPVHGKFCIAEDSPGGISQRKEIHDACAEKSNAAQEYDKGI